MDGRTDGGKGCSKACGKGCSQGCSKGAAKGAAKGAERGMARGVASGRGEGGRWRLLWLELDAASPMLLCEDGAEVEVGEDVRAWLGLGWG